MRKMICRLMAMCSLPVSLAALAQSGDTMKQDTMQQPDQMKHNNRNADTRRRKRSAFQARSVMTGRCSWVIKTTKFG